MHIVSANWMAHHFHGIVLGNFFTVLIFCCMENLFRARMSRTNLTFDTNRTNSIEMHSMHTTQCNAFYSFITQFRWLQTLCGYFAPISVTISYTFWDRILFDSIWIKSTYKVIGCFLVVMSKHRICVVFCLVSRSDAVGSTDPTTVDQFENAVWKLIGSCSIVSTQIFDLKCRHWVNSWNNLFQY